MFVFLVGKKLDGCAVMSLKSCTLFANYIKTSTLLNCPLVSISYELFKSLVSTGDTGRQPSLLPPLRAAISVDIIIHNYRLSTPPYSNAMRMD